jgi:ribosome-binding protein aMBF1 (putative translation factor)
MSTDFTQLIADIEQEARDEGPQAVRELERFSEEFSLASQIIESRRGGGLSQRDLAKLSGVPQSEISRIETGASNPTYATITALLGPLGKRVQLVDAENPAGTGAKRAKRGTFIAGSAKVSSGRASSRRAASRG